MNNANLIFIINSSHLFFNSLNFEVLKAFIYIFKLKRTLYCFLSIPFFHFCATKQLLFMFILKEKIKKTQKPASMRHNSSKLQVIIGLLYKVSAQVYELWNQIIGERKSWKCVSKLSIGNKSFLILPGDGILLLLRWNENW